MGAGGVRFRGVTGELAQMRDDLALQLINVLKEIRDEVRESNRNEYRLQVTEVGGGDEITIRLFKDKPSRTSGVSGQAVALAGWDIVRRV